MKNLLSVRTMTKLDAEVRFCGDTCSVMKQGKTVEIGKSVNGGLYKLFSPVVETLDSALFASTKASLSVWHQRFGHLNMQDINSISKNNNIVDGMKIDTGEDDNNDCGSCALGKMHRLPFPKKSEHRAKSALELIHTDLCGPMQVETVGGSKIR